jgi:hypothetical protein
MASIPEAVEESDSEQSSELEQEEAKQLQAALKRGEELKQVSEKIRRRKVQSAKAGELEGEETKSMPGKFEPINNTKAGELECEETKSMPGKSEHTVDVSGLELKATKADDARVRVEMWDTELGNVMGVGESEALRQSAEAIRIFCLRWWRRRVTRSFFCWLHQKPEHQGAGLDDMAHVVEQAQVNAPEQPEQDCRWAPLGRAVHCCWWSGRDAQHHKDLRSAREVVEQSSRASWFEWADGSTPVHWKCTGDGKLRHRAPTPTRIFGMVWTMVGTVCTYH